jgi:hypothetical protein
MRHGRSSDQRGMSRAGLIFGIVLIIGFGALGWWALTGEDAPKPSPKSPISRAAQQAIDSAKCSYADTDLCKFFAGYRAQSSYTVTTTAETQGQRTNTILKKQNKDTYYLRSEAGSASEVINIGDTRYTKTGDGTWQKQTVPPGQAATYAASADIQLTEPQDAKDANVSYKKIGTTACGSQTCLKYQIATLTDAQTQTYVWFDKDNYQLRRIESSGPSGSKQIIYSLASANIAVPSPLTTSAAVLSATGDATLPRTGDEY